MMCGLPLDKSGQDARAPKKARAEAFAFRKTFIRVGARLCTDDDGLRKPVVQGATVRIDERVDEK
jgi:hypothetical protein